MSLEDRVGSLEISSARHGEQLGRLSADLSSVRASVGEVGTDVKALLQREARKPPSLTFQTVALTCSAIGAIAAVGWWLIGTAPAVVELRDRMGRLDDPQVGRVPRLEREMEQVNRSWRTAVTRTAK